MIKVRYTPGHKGRGTFNGVAPGEVTEVSERDFERFRSVYTPVDEEERTAPAPEPDEEPKEKVVDLLPLIRESDDEDWLKAQRKDSRKTVADAASARLRALDNGSADGS